MTRASTASGIERRKQSSKAMTSTQAQKTRFEDEVIDPSVCCMCFGTYEEDILEGQGQIGYLVLAAGGCTKTVWKSAALTGWTRAFLSCLCVVFH